MAGILSSKSRIFDTILTPEGRKQLAEGQLKAKFYSFSDFAAIYKQDTIVSGGLTDTHRFILEATGLPQDNIIFEVDDSGKLSAFPASGSIGFTVLQGQIFSGSNEGQRSLVSGSQFFALSQTLLSHSLNAFRNQMLLKSPDPLDDRKTEFIVGPTFVSYSITENKPIEKNKITEANINQIESLFYDKRLSHLRNFKFLPPRNKPRIGEKKGSLLGNYVDISQASIDSFDTLQQELNTVEKRTIHFTETSTENNIFGQFFEIGGNVMKKLDVVDFGTFSNPNGGEPLHVFFVGKVFIDDLGSHTFVNMFTMVFE
jgi:hypothetical protein